ncbi:hypothetical protein HHK36_017530 [Tetracentron sinense]|uniref:YTH domain-containing family protein n=1 Tax=Tetracentron sinense TaxID=13715 RepID=A0A835DFT6_TETSI|nr:hypothetical protein HHK36_017530 [Tetracentron sinense]
MAAVAAPADQAADLLQKLSLDSQTKALEVPEPIKKPSAVQYGFADSGEAGNGQIQSFERSTTPLLQDFIDPAMCYLPNAAYPSTTYYYGGYDGSVNEWEDYARYVNPDGVEMSPGIYGDNGSLMYHHSYGYAPYGAYTPTGSPVPTMGHDGQLYGPQHYQYPTPYYPPTPTTGPYTPNQVAALPGEVSTSIAPDQVPSSIETGHKNTKGTANSGSVDGNTGSAPLRPSFQNSFLSSNGSYGRGILPPGSGYQDPRFGFDGMRSPIPWSDGPIYSDGQPRPATSTSVSSAVSHINSIPSGRNQNIHPLPHLMGLHHPRPTPVMGSPGFMNGMYPNNRMYGHGGNTVRTGPGFGSNGYDSRTNGRGWLPIDSKYKPRGRGNGFFGYGNTIVDGLNELNRGPRAKGFKNQKAFAPITLAVKGQNISSNGCNNENKDKLSVCPDKEQYNREDFLDNYSDAKFFIIKSYSEDDVHKSIKYSVWASTPNGNKKLDAGYKEAQEKSGGCPVFLFFSVNTSGQFVGLAEMLGSVDFNKNLEYWQQDKWNGCFPVKWHIVKDVPNNLLKHITLENNENKPVTNSRDTQEVKIEQGLQMLKIFKDHSSKTCILDDFGFYEDRQKKMQEKKVKQQQFRKQVWDGKPTDATEIDEKDKEGVNGKPRLRKSLEVVSALASEPEIVVQANGEWKLSEENGSVAGAGDVTKDAKPVVITENGVANGC